MVGEGSFPGGGRAGDLLRATDWSRTSLGPPAGWPAALKAHVRAMLHTRQPMCIFWGEDLVNLYNDGFLPILGEKHPSAMGQRAEECWSEAWPIVGPQLRQVLDGECVFHEEVLVPIARGGRVEDAWWNYSYSPLFDDDGAVSGVLVICTEVTSEVVARMRMDEAKREAELARQDLHRVFMQAPVPMCILTGEDHRFTLANGPYLKLVGREVLGKTVREAFTAEEASYYLPLLDRVYRTGEELVLKEAPLRLGDAGSESSIDFGYYPHRDANDSITGVLVVIHDLTAQVTARREVEAASRAKDEFLATVSHELRTPLTAILAWSRILSRAADRARIEKGIAIIERNARAQAKIIEDILDVSRIISGKLRLTLKRLDIATTIDAAIESIQPAAAAKGVQLRVDVDAPEPLFADEDRVQQIVWNLLSNAVKFTPAGGEVTVLARQQEQAVRITVRDTGTGISAAFLPYAFDRFRQGDASTTKQHAGLGLGLAIVRHLVELHGGTVCAKSDGEGHGATFDVVLPIRGADINDEHDAPGDRSERRSAEHGRSGDALRGIRVLVVDDQRDTREVVAMMLEDAGAKVLQADAAPTALSVLATTEVAAIVSDIGMPGQDGYAFLESVRANAAIRTIPALALTAFARAEDRARALASGFQGHVAKPIDPARLVAEVATLVGR